MEFFTVLLSVLIGVVSPVGVVSERVAAGLIRDRLSNVEDLQVRIDNAPSYRLAQGRVDRVRIAGRGVFPEPDLRLEAVEVETDSIALQPNRLIRSGRVVLERPLRAGVRLVVNQEDVNRALRSPTISRRVRQLSLGALGRTAGSSDQYELVDPQTTFLPNNRVRVQVTLRSQRTQQDLNIIAEAGLGIESGRRLRILNPSLSLNGQAVPSQFLQPLLAGFAQRLDLRTLERSGITARVLQLETKGNELAIGAFVQVSPEAIR